MAGVRVFGHNPAARYRLQAAAKPWLSGGTHVGRWTRTAGGAADPACGIATELTQSAVVRAARNGSRRAACSRCEPTKTMGVLCHFHYILRYWHTYLAQSGGCARWRRVVGKPESFRPGSGTAGAVPNPFMNAASRGSWVTGLLCALAMLAACSGEPPSGSQGTGGGGNGGAGSLGGSSGSGGSGGFPACGTQVCSTNQICVHPTCAGGVPLQCAALNDAGACPSGWTYDAQCASMPSPKPGCRPPPCVDPPAFCTNIPSSCGSNLTCSCLPTTICNNSGSCGLIQNGNSVICMSA